MPILLLIIILPVLLFVGGCAQGNILHKVYDFEVVDVPLAVGRLHISSRGLTASTERNDGLPFYIKHTGPYYFKIAFLTDEPPGMPVEINIVKVSPEQGRFIDLDKNLVTKKNVIIHTGDCMGEKKYSNNNLYSSGYDVSLADVRSGHTPFSLEIEVHFKGMVERV